MNGPPIVKYVVDILRTVLQPYGTGVRRATIGLIRRGTRTRRPVSPGGKSA